MNSDEASGDSGNRQGGRPFRVQPDAVSAAAAFGVFSIGALVLIGWACNIAVLKSLQPGLISMKANTAVAFLLTGLALWLLQAKRVHAGAGRHAAWACASVVAALGLFTLAENVFRWDLGIDQLLFAEPAGTAQTVHPGRMAPTTALNFLLIGVSLLLLDVRTRRGHRPAQYLIPCVGIISGVALLGYVYGVSVLFSPSAAVNPMSVPAALAGLLAFASLFLARPGPWLLGILTDEKPGSLMTRRFFLPILLLPAVLDVVLLSGQHAGLYDDHIAAAAHNTLMTAIFLGVVLVAAAWLNRSEDKLHASGPGQVGGLSPRSAMPETRPSAQLWSIWSVVLVAAATLLRLGFLQLLGTRATYITFYPAVTLAALYGGLPAGLLATVLSAMVADYLWLQPTHTFAITDPADWLSIAIFIVSGTLISVVAEAMHRARARASQAETQARVAAERARAAEAMRESEDRLRFALETSHTGAWDLDLVDHTAFRSLEHDRVFGYAELLPKWTYEMFLEHVLPEDRAAVDANFRHAMTTQGDWSFECRIRRADGETRWIWGAGRHRTDADGKARRMAGIVQDITPRKQAEEVLRRTHEELEIRVQQRTAELKQASAYNRSLLESSLDPLVTIGPDGKLTDVNAAAEMATGRGRAALVGTDFSDYFTDPAKARAGYQHVFREGFVRDYPLEVRHRDGRVTPVLYNASVYRDESGKVIGVFAAARDVAAQKRAETALRESERRYRTLFETMDEGFCVAEMIYDANGKPVDYRFVEINPAFEKHAGLKGALGRTIREMVPTLEAHWFEIFDRVARTGEAVRFENRAAAMNRDYDVYASRVGGPESRRVAILFNDITERKRAEEEIRRYTEDLRRSNQDLEHFAYVASHDLQEPLRVVSSFSQLLARRYQGKLDADADEFIAFVVDGAKRMQTLINDLLTFSRVGTRGHPFAPVECEAILRAVRENLDLAIAESGAVITHDPLPTLLADETQLTQLFQNLFSNAIKFHRPETPPRIHVSAARQDGDWRLSVRDNGIGIDQRYFERIFILFQRLHGRETYPGTGIGLAVCKKIVERHGGRMWVESEPGTGSAFHFTIPEGKKG